MRSLKKYAVNYEFDYDKLLAYGFKKNKEIYLYEKLICDDIFKVIISITHEEQSSVVIDMNTNEEYVLVDVSTSVGEFVGRVRTEYEKVLDDVLANCSSRNVFKSKQAKEVINYIKDKFGDDLEYLWQVFPNNAIWRNKVNNKWYGALLVVGMNKLGLDGDSDIHLHNKLYKFYILSPF